jgi:diaminopimelate decarboxylase
MHIGSQITQVKPFAAAVRKMLPLVKMLKAKHGIEFFDIGGGMGIVYTPALESGQRAWWKGGKLPMTPADYAKAVVPLLKNLGLKILIEPGRFIVGNAGILVTEVLYVKKTGRKTFAIVDAGMNDLIRPTLYESYHQIVPVRQPAKGTRVVKTDVVGPVCESGDYFAKDRPLPVVNSGGRLALLSAGAYGFVMASNYNTRPRPAEILVQGKKVKLARKRETLADLIRGEKR